jgi:hypothetical membrane protein
MRRVLRAHAGASWRAEVAGSLIEPSSQGVRWWTVLSASAAPLFLAGGWTIAAGRQPVGYDSVRDTISSLAARGATDRWIMTTALAGVGACYIVSGLGLRPAQPRGRAFLMGGGIATILVAAFPQPARGNSVAHTVTATVAFTALSVWPALAACRRSRVPLLSRGISVTASLTMLGLLTWFVLEAHGSHRGLAERSAAFAEALWPLLVVTSSVASASGYSARHRREPVAPSLTTTGIPRSSDQGIGS